MFKSSEGVDYFTMFLALFAVKTFKGNVKVTVLLEYLTALLEYLDLILQTLPHKSGGGAPFPLPMSFMYYIIMYRLSCLHRPFTVSRESWSHVINHLMISKKRLT